MKITFFQWRLKYPIRLIRFPQILGNTFEGLEFHSPTIPLSPVSHIDLYTWWPLISLALICPQPEQLQKRLLWKIQIQLTSFNTFGWGKKSRLFTLLSILLSNTLYIIFIDEQCCHTYFISLFSHFIQSEIVVEVHGTLIQIGHNSIYMALNNETWQEFITLNAWSNQIIISTYITSKS